MGWLLKLVAGVDYCHGKMYNLEINVDFHEIRVLNAHLEWCKLVQVIFKYSCLRSKRLCTVQTLVPNLEDTNIGSKVFTF